MSDEALILEWWNEEETLTPVNTPVDPCATTPIPPRETEEERNARIWAEIEKAARG